MLFGHFFDTFFFFFCNFPCNFSVLDLYSFHSPTLWLTPKSKENKFKSVSLHDPQTKLPQCESN